MINNFMLPEYKFLANFYKCDIEYEGLIYPSVEHAFQAAKMDDEANRLTIQHAETARAAKRLGRSLAKKNNWDLIKIVVMRQLLDKKFQLTELRAKLLSTKNSQLVAGGDKYWGMIDGIGTNHLGNLLMEIRTEIVKAQTDMLDVASREFLRSCCWNRQVDGDFIYVECWSPPWDNDCWMDLFSAVECQRLACQ